LILITGATGFLGFQVVQKLDEQGYDVLLGLRNYSDKFSQSMSQLVIGDIASQNNILNKLDSVDVIIHTAARAHVVKDTHPNTLSEYRKVNTQSTLNLAKQAALSGVRRFVFISSIGVNGSITTQPFTELEPPSPHSDYALSKFEAEIGLLEISNNTDLEVVIIRPPLVYGPNPPGNFSTLVKLVKKNYLLPLASVTGNKRSLIALDNLVDFILLCADYNKTPQAANQVFVISDGEDVSTAQLFHRVAKAYGTKSSLFPFPPSFLKFAARLIGKQGKADQLLGSLQVNSSKARELLNWKPVITMQEQLKKMAEADKPGKTNN